MASVASSGAASPHSAFGVGADGEEQEDPWTHIGFPGSSNASSVGFFPSPASGSLQSWGVIEHTGQIVELGPFAPSPPAPSPLHLDSTLQQQQQQHASFPPSTYAEQASSFAPTSGLLDLDTQFLQTGDPQTAGYFPSSDFQFTEEELGNLPYLNTFDTTLPLTGLEGILPETLPPVGFEIPQSMQTGPNASPWNATDLKGEHVFALEGFVSPSPSQQNDRSSPSASPAQASGSLSPAVKQESQSPGHSLPIVIRKVRGAGARVEKKKAATATSSISSGSSGESIQFHIATVDTIQAGEGKPNQFECFELMRPSQRGRKGPLANETKESALQVRRLGACFCCHARKVKCDKERPCKNCKKLCAQVPQVVCWQFQDFLGVLFPELIRSHFRKEEMTKFITENIEAFRINGEERPCEVTLFSGPRFAATLTLKAKFFTPKTKDVQQHYHVTIQQSNMNLRARATVPVGLEIEGSAQKDELRRKTREYIQQILQEPSYPEQFTDVISYTGLPREILQIVRDYAQQTDSPIVRKALSIYAMHYIMSRQLCLTRQAIINLAATQLVPQNVDWLTTRVLARQVKAVLDELLQREVQSLFDAFSKSLKPKSRREWAPCLAAFLVLTLFMEGARWVTDIFVTHQNQIDMENRHPRTFRREEVLRDVVRQMQALPFRQFAFQFHQVYQTHSRDAATKGFNPLVDLSPLEQGDLDEPAAQQMVMRLRALLEQPHLSELERLTRGSMLPNNEEHPYPRDISSDYNGRLVARFLLSFKDEGYIWGLDD